MDSAHPNLLLNQMLLGNDIYQMGYKPVEAGHELTFKRMGFGFPAFNDLLKQLPHVTVSIPTVITRRKNDQGENATKRANFNVSPWIFIALGDLTVEEAASCLGLTLDTFIEVIRFIELPCCCELFPDLIGSQNPFRNPSVLTDSLNCLAAVNLYKSPYLYLSVEEGFQHHFMAVCIDSRGIPDGSAMEQVNFRFPMEAPAPLQRQE
jgi:hypothetical protein